MESAREQAGETAARLSDEVEKDRLGSVSCSQDCMGVSAGLLLSQSIFSL